MEELYTILVGLDQRSKTYKTRLHELEKHCGRLDHAIATLTNDLDLANTRSRADAHQTNHEFRPAHPRGAPSATHGHAPDTDYGRQLYSWKGVRILAAKKKAKKKK